MRHTKGPWFVGSSVEGRGVHIYSDADGRSVAWVEPYRNAIDEETERVAVSGPMQEHPDVILMAAAPALYAALSEMTERARMQHPHFESGPGAETFARAVEALSHAGGPA